MSKAGMLGDQEALCRVWGGPLKDLLSKLNGPDGRKWERALARFLRKEPTWLKHAWQRTLRVKLENGEEVELAAVSLAELDLVSHTERATVYERATSRGLSLCNAMIVRALTPGPKGLCADERIFIAEKPLTISGGVITLAATSRAGVTFPRASGDFVFSSTDRLVFIVD